MYTMDLSSSGQWSHFSWRRWWSTHAPIDNKRVTMITLNSFNQLTDNVFHLPFLFLESHKKGQTTTSIDESVVTVVARNDLGVGFLSQRVIEIPSGIDIISNQFQARSFCRTFHLISRTRTGHSVDYLREINCILKLTNPTFAAAAADGSRSDKHSFPSAIIHFKQPTTTASESCVECL